MRSLGISLLVAVAIHLDWHLARPLHHRLSLHWSYHWALTASIFALAGWLVARMHHPSRWRHAVLVLLGGVVIGQIVEPVLESIIYANVLGFAVEPERWAAFFRTLAAAVPAYAVAVLLSDRKARQCDAHDALVTRP